MSFTACGISHLTAPIAIREKVAILPERIPSSLQNLVCGGQVREAAILSTCNRTEVYGDSDDVHEIVDWLHDWHQLPRASLTPYLYSYRDQAAVRHLLRVASGLDSMALGEPQIFGQLKSAYNTAKQAGTIGSYLQRIFQHVFSVTKRVRSDTAIGTHPISIAYASVQLTKRIFEDLSQLNVLLLGAGETIELVAQYLHEHNVKQLWFANRTESRAQALALQFKGAAMSLKEALPLLSQMDIVMSATHSALPILGKGAVETALKNRKHRPMMMMDFGVPRNIEAEVAQLSDIYLFTVDDLQGVVNENLQNRRFAAKEAEQIIDLQAAHFIRKLNSLDCVPLIRAYRDKMGSFRDEELTHALQQLKQGSAPEVVLAEFARVLTNKLMHIPTQKIRDAAYDDQSEFLELVKRLFEL